MWAGPLAALTSGLRNMGLSQFRAKELLLLENELQVCGKCGGCAGARFRHEVRLNASYHPFPSPPCVLYLPSSPLS